MVAILHRHVPAHGLLRRQNIQMTKLISQDILCGHNNVAPAAHFICNYTFGRELDRHSVKRDESLELFSIHCVHLNSLHYEVSYLPVLN